VAQQILATLPGACLAQDSAGRETDIAIDHSEFAHLEPAQIQQVLQQMQTAGLHASVSSIHINGWLGPHNKLQGAHWIVQSLLQRALGQELDAWAYIGDSTNDQLMFEAFASSVGVANVARFVPQLKHLPRYVTRSARGAGFEEMAQAILRARPAPSGPGCGGAPLV
jgi:hydroxymethylpyrimidine pyrophosphatase-like HAD family hydrolase